MSPKPVAPRALARRDMREATTHYQQTAGERVALRFVEAVRATFAAIGQQPRAGSTRYAVMLGRPGLRSWPIARYPYLVFYREGEQRIEVLRVLHGRRDIASLLDAPP